MDPNANVRTIEGHRVEFFRGANSTEISDHDGVTLIRVVGELGNRHAELLITAYYRGWGNGRARGYNEAQQNMRKALGITP